MDLHTISQQLRNIQANTDEAGHRHTERLLASAAMEVQKRWPEIRKTLGVLSADVPESELFRNRDFPHPVEQISDTTHDTIRLWNMTWGILCEWLSPRLELRVHAHDQTRRKSVEHPDKWLKVSAATHDPADWRGRSHAAADIIDAVLQRLRPVPPEQVFDVTIDMLRAYTGHKSDTPIRTALRDESLDKERRGKADWYQYAQLLTILKASKSTKQFDWPSSVAGLK